ncbi:phage baseplate plug family protein [Aggregatibacter segnis]|uniref:phage baseplate plug family protein n=1 Tax=Aggregatibacter segnis TaxID=739 RepID=UPI003FA0BE55
MKQIPVTQSPHQEQTFEFNGTKIRLTLRFNSVSKFWAMDVFEPVNQKQICTGQALACNVPILERSTQPYFFYLEDESGAELDSVGMSDLGTRCFLYIGEKS